MKPQVMVQHAASVMLDTDSMADAADHETQLHEKSEFVDGAPELTRSRRLRSHMANSQSFKATQSVWRQGFPATP